MKSKLLMAICLFPCFVPLVSCKEKSPAEKTGDAIENAAEKVKDAVDPQGPAEKTGEKIDNALGN